MKTRLLAGLGAAVMLGATLTSCAGPNGRAAQAAAATVEVTRGDLAATVSGSGSVKPIRQVALSFATNGVVKDINVREGQQVPAGRELATLDPSDLDQQVNQAQANYERAVQQEKALPERATDADRKAADASTRASLAQFTLARLNRAKASLRAPFAGIVTQIGVNEGEPGGQKTAVVIADTSSLQIEATVAENDVSKLKLDQTVNVTFDALPNVTLAGVVTFIAPAGTIQQNVNTYLVRVKLAATDPQLRLGMTANIAAVTAEHPNVLQLPIEAVRTSGNQQVVTVKRGETISEVPVTTGLSNDINVEITGGLNEHDLVVLADTTQ